MLSQLVAACTDRIERERVGPAPDPAVLARYSALQTEFIDRRGRLRAEDAAAVDEVLATARATDRRIMSGTA